MSAPFSVSSVRLSTTPLASLKIFRIGWSPNPHGSSGLATIEPAYALIVPPPSKTDRFGIVWGEKPMCFPLRFDAPYCAALQLRRWELACPLHGEHRREALLFVQDVGVPFTFHILSILSLLKAAKPLIMPDVEDNSAYTYHSFRVLLATQLASWARHGARWRRFSL